tara:strand:- start:457 stop:1215 length:759 start_codon:yes stop_codon:yes gene_type:complete
MQITFIEAVFVTCALSIASNVFFGATLGNVSCKYHLTYSPSTEAFAIWSVIYLLGFITIFSQWASDNLMLADPYANLFYSVAWLSAAIWTPIFVTDKKCSHILAAFVLCVCGGCALTAAVIEHSWQRGVEERRRWYIGAPFSMLAGWTLCAAAISIGIAKQANGNNTPHTDCTSERRGYNMFNTNINTESYSYAPFFLATIATILSSILPDPILPIPVMWCIFHMKSSYLNCAGFLLLTAGCLIAIARIYLL